jgi:hypothetical protein
MKDFLGIFLFTLGVAFLAFLLGAAVGIFRFFPYGPINDAYLTAYQLLNPDAIESVDDDHFLQPARYPGAGITVNETDRIQPGVTLLTSYWHNGDRWQPAIRIIDMEGNVLHQWIIRPDRIWPETPFDDHVGAQMANPNNYVHGTWLLPDGDVIFNVEYAGLARMNACGEIKWTLPYRTHHSVFMDDDGNFWASGLIWRYETINKYVHPKPTFVDETALKVSPDGEILEEIFILESIYDSGFGDVLADVTKNYDITHLNDVEILSESMADAFPTLAAGDIMVSLRNLGLVLVLDGETSLIKWYIRHPLVRQHDPDFEPDGHITIYDNRDDMTLDGMRLGPTRLLRVNPATGESGNAYPLNEEQYFYSQMGGKHQLLDNGNRLITDTIGGRVIEVDRAGDTVWSWQNDTRDGMIPEVLEGTRYPTSMATFDTSSCD